MEKKDFYYHYLCLAKISAKILQLLPKPLLTEDQLRLLKYDNCKSGNYKNNYDLGLNTIKKFEEEIKNIVIIGDQVDNFLKITIKKNK